MLLLNEGTSGAAFSGKSQRGKMIWRRVQEFDTLEGELRLVC